MAENMIVTLPGSLDSGGNDTIGTYKVAHPGRMDHDIHHLVPHLPL